MLVFIEKKGGFLLFLIVSICIYHFLKPRIYNYYTIIEDYPSFGFSIFGFLLTLLGLILQGQSDTITLMKKREILYKKFIVLNKKVVFISLITSVIAYSMRLLCLNPLQSKFVIIEHISISIFIGLVSWLLSETIYFLFVFYTLIRK